MSFTVNFNGAALVFPDGTTPEEVRAAIARAHGGGGGDFADVSGGASSTAAPAPPPPPPASLDSGIMRDTLMSASPLDPLLAKRAELADVAQHGDVGKVDIADPGYGGMAVSSLNNTVGRYFMGALQRAYGESPDIQNLSDAVGQDYQQTRENFHAADPGGELGGVRGAFDAASEAGNQALLGMALPFPAGRAAAAESSGARLLSAAGHGAAVGGLTGYAQSAGLPWQDQLRETGTQAAMGMGFGLLGGAREISGREAALRPGVPPPDPVRPVDAPPPPAPQLRQQALDAYVQAKGEAQQAPMMHPEIFQSPDGAVAAQAIVDSASKGVDARFSQAFARGGFLGDETLATMADQTSPAKAPEVEYPPLKPGERFAEATKDFLFGKPETPEEVKFREYAEAKGYTPDTLPEPLYHEYYDPGSVGAHDPADSRTIMGPDPGGYELNLFGRNWTIGGRDAPQIDPQAGFLGIGRRKGPTPPADPFETVVAHGDTSPARSALDTMQAVADRMTDEFLNKEDAPVRRLRRAGFPDAANMMELLQARARGARGMVEPGKQAGPLVEGTYVFDPAANLSRRTGDGLSAVLGGVKAPVLRDLNDMMAAQHHLELEGRQQTAAQNYQHEFLLQSLGVIPPDPPVVPHSDMNLSIDPRGTQLAHAKLAELSSRYGVDPASGRINGLQDLAAGVRDWSIRSTLIPLREAGRLSPEEFDFHPNQANPGTWDYTGRIVDAGPHYAPFFRLMDALGEDPEILQGSTKANPIQKISGGLSPDRPIAPPLESFLTQAQRVTVWAERQRTRNFFADQVDKSPELQQEIKKVPTAAGQNGLPVHVRGTFPVWRDGVKSEYGAPADVIGAFEKLTPKQVNPILQVARFASRTLRAGATFTPEFALRNLPRDQGTAAAYGAQYHFRPFVEPISVLWDSVMHHDRYRQYSTEWRTNGGALSGMISNQRPEIQAALEDVTGSHAFGSRVARRWKAEGYLGKAFFPILAPMEAFSETMENATRLGAYTRARSKGANPLEAARFSREATLDFSRSGRFAQEWNGVEAFANANLQDAYGFVRAMRQRPAATTIHALTYLTVPAVINWWKWHDDPQYQAEPEWEKASFLHLAKRDDQRFWRIPRPLGLLNLGFSYGVEKFLNTVADKDPDAAKSFAEQMVQQSPAQYLPRSGSFDWIPTLGQPLAEVAAGAGGWSSFRNGPIVPQGLQGQLPEDQALDSTSNLARGVGNATGTSPLKVEYLLQAYGGGWGRTISQMSGNNQPPLPTTAADIPGVRGFISPPAVGFGSDPVSKFYDLTTMAAQADQSMKTALDNGDALRYQRIVKEHPEALMLDALMQTRTELNELRKTRNLIRKVEGMDSHQRADELLSLDMAATQLAGATMHGAADYLRGNH